MIQFLVTAVIVVICLFLLAVLLCLMIWVITKLLRFLFPSKFGSIELKKKKEPKKASAQRMEDRCPNCTSFGMCPMAFDRAVVYPCKFYIDGTAEEHADE